MVFGRTYFSPPLQKWGMPIRKTIRNEAGDPQFVITTVLKHTSTFDALFNTLKHRHHLNLSIIRDHDLYYQYHSNGHQDYEKVYNAPFSSQTMEKLFTSIFDTYSLTPKELKENELLVSFLYHQGKEGYYLASLKYNHTYHLWIFSQTPLSVIIKDFMQKTIIYLLIFFSIGSIFFTFFVSSQEQRKSVVMSFLSKPHTINSPFFLIVITSTNIFINGFIKMRPLLVLFMSIWITLKRWTIALVTIMVITC